jgi:hypothetical protein
MPQTIRFAFRPEVSGEWPSVNTKDNPRGRLIFKTCFSKLETLLLGTKSVALCPE